MQNTKKESKLYFPELDGLRFLAFLMVFVHHSPSIYFLPLFSTFHNYGWMGVDLFLCLSAFLFTRLLYAEYQASGTINIKNFYIRRGLRIWPLYVFFVAGVTLITVISLGWSQALGLRVLGLATFTDDIFSAFMGYNYAVLYASHLWTISYEEQFYLVIPWFLRALFKATFKTKAIVLGTIFLFFSAIRAVLIYFNVPHPAIWVLPVTHFETILGGLAVGLGIFDRLFHKFSNWLLLAAGIVCLAGVCLLPNGWIIGWSLMLTYPLLGLGMSLILYSFVKSEKWVVKSLMQNKVLAYLGKISYGLYLYHFGVIYAAISLAERLRVGPGKVHFHPIFVFVVGLVLTCLVSMASYQWLEKPFLRLKERFTTVHSRPI